MNSSCGGRMNTGRAGYRRLGLIAHEEEHRYGSEGDQDGSRDGEADHPPRTVEESCGAGGQASEDEKAGHRQGDEERHGADVLARDDRRTRLPYLAFRRRRDRPGELAPGRGGTAAGRALDAGSGTGRAEGVGAKMVWAGARPLGWPGCVAIALPMGYVRVVAGRRTRGGTPDPTAGLTGQLNVCPIVYGSERLGLIARLPRGHEQRRANREPG